MEDAVSRVVAALIGAGYLNDNSKLERVEEVVRRVYVAFDRGQQRTPLDVPEHPHLEAPADISDEDPAPGPWVNALDEIRGGRRPYVPREQSVLWSTIVCLDDGERAATLNTHLKRLGINRDEYLERWGLPQTYPAVSPRLAKARAENAKKASAARYAPETDAFDEDSGAARPRDPAVDGPAVPIEDSITDDYIVCLEDGKKLKVLKRHLMNCYGLTPEQYRGKWGLPEDYPMTAPNYAQARDRQARYAGSGKHGT